MHRQTFDGWQSHYEGSRVAAVAVVSVVSAQVAPVAQVRPSNRRNHAVPPFWLLTLLRQRANQEAEQTQAICTN